MALEYEVATLRDDGSGSSSYSALADALDSGRRADVPAPPSVSDDLVIEVHRRVSRFTSSSSLEMEKLKIRRILEAAAVLQKSDGHWR